MNTKSSNDLDARDRVQLPLGLRVTMLIGLLLMLGGRLGGQSVTSLWISMLGGLIMMGGALSAMVVLFRARRRRG
jgi:hypothetical protein